MPGGAGSELMFLRGHDHGRIEGGSAGGPGNAPCGFSVVTTTAELKAVAQACGATDGTSFSVVTTTAELKAVLSGDTAPDFVVSPWSRPRPN